ncbi:MAG TPA: ATP-binding protein [Pirellulales bacterium]|jgi:signal transduction histidine kinase|nr:ATP-binding protein [Pirellulales bacterium]
MSVDPAIIRAERHAEIGSLIEQDIDVLIGRWARRAVEEQPTAERSHHQALVDHLHELLRGLARSLAESDGSAALQHCRPAMIHGETRWETGWSLAEVVRDYQILRLVLLDYLDEALACAPGPRALMAIGLALDEAISASVAAYVRSRDQYQRQLEAERADRDNQILEYLRQKAEALKEVDRRKNEFITVLGHEMRNPLAPLWHAVSVLEIIGRSDASVLEVRDIVRRQVHQLTRLADDLLDISRIAQGKIELRKAPVDVSQAVAQAVETSTPYLRARLHQLDLAPPAEPLWVNGDASRLVQVLGNLLNNAAKYTEPGGRISLIVERENEQAVIRVRDNGIGIPPSMLPHVFELFTQGEWSANHSRDGMGIGLALVRRLVQLHGGTIDASSEGVGHGSEFVVRLPAIAPATAPRPAPPQPDQLQEPAPTSAAGRRILVVDDNVDTTTTLGMLLAVERHVVKVAHDGPAALTAAQEFRPDVILLDIGLPRMDGYEVARRLRELAEMKAVLLVALTGYGQDEDRRRSAEAGFDSHLVKPVSLEALREAVGKAR